MPGVLCFSVLLNFTFFEKQQIIAVKELMAINFGFKSFLPFYSGHHVLIRTDNTEALSYVNNMDGLNCPIMDSYARKLWSLAHQHSIWLSANFIPGKENSQADLASHKLTQFLEWSIPQSLFFDLTTLFGKPAVDLFASWLNNKLHRYVSMIPNLFAMDIDAFTVSWSDEFPYLFPPFNLIHRCLQKI